jgi:predicted phosphodiesterase
VTIRLAILADVHGNLPALEAVLADAKQQGANDFIAAGDYIGGPQPEETLALLYSTGARMIRGNHEQLCLDAATGNVPATWFKARQWASARWWHSRMSEESMRFIATMPEQLVVALKGMAPIRVVHGSPWHVSESLYPDRDPAVLDQFVEAGLPPADGALARLGQAMHEMAEAVLVCGHTHIAWTQEQGGQLALNPGSVGAPINGDTRAQYALLDWQAGHWRATLRAVEYDLPRMRAAWVDTGLLDYGGAYAQACLLGNETGRNIPWYLVTHARHLAEQEGHTGHGPLPDDLWERAVATFAPPD